MKRCHLISPEDQRAMQDGRVASSRKHQRAISARAAGRLASSVASASSRAAASAMRDLAQETPTVHEKHSSITASQSSDVLRIMQTVYMCMNGHPKWLAEAVRQASHSCGISDRLVRYIWSHYESTRKIYETREIHPQSPGSSETFAEECGWLEAELDRLCAIGCSQTLQTIRVRLENHFHRAFTDYRVSQLLRSIDCVYNHIRQDWTLSMRSPRRPRQLMCCASGWLFLRCSVLCELMATAKSFFCASDTRCEPN
jgi:hypothetical protein